MIGGLISNALGEGTGNGLITSALCMSIKKSGAAKLIINATDMNYSTGARYKSTWCYGYLKNANGDKINSGQNICNTTFDEIEAGKYTIDIVSAQNVKLNFQTHYEFTVKAGETKTVNLDNERYFVQYMFELEAGDREKGCFGVINPPEKYTVGANTVIYEEGECVSKFSNYKLIVDNQIIAETEDYIIDSLSNYSKIGNYSYEAPNRYGNAKQFVTEKRASTLKSFNPYSNVFTYEYISNTVDNPTSIEVTNYLLNIDKTVQSVPNDVCALIKNYVVYNKVPSFYILYDTKQASVFQTIENGKWVNYNITYLQKNARSGGPRLSQAEIEERRKEVLRQETESTKIDNVREYEGKLIKYDEQLCNAISDLNSQYKWVVGSYTTKYVEPYKWQYSTYTGFTYKSN